MDQGIVTGEGVLLDNRPTSAPVRLLAALVDLAALVVVLILAAVVLGRVPWTISENGAQILSVVMIVTVTVILPTTVETLTRGRSLGKLATGIRVVRDDGGPVRFRQALVRALVGLVELWATLGSVAFICSVVQPQGKRLGDLAAGTYAVRVRGKVTRRAVVPMPPPLAAWAARADVARLPDGLALSVRQFLVRAPGLHPGSRVTMGRQLAGQVSRYVAPLPPAGAHPEAFLAAVVATRRDRDYAVAVRAAARTAHEAEVAHRLPHGVPDPAR